MFGRVRNCSSTSLESLETQRLPSKLLKEDSLSIYEATLIKLKQGSQRKLAPISISTLTCPPEPMKIDTTSTSSESNSSQSIPNEEVIMPMNSDCSVPLRVSKERIEKSMSIVELFSKFRNTHQSTCENGCSEQDFGSRLSASNS